MANDSKPTQEELDQSHADPNCWKLGIFYFNPKDKRIFPPKRIPGLGWTVNFANPLSVLVMVGLIVGVYFITVMIRR
ncbi:MAG: hypothetical protein IPP51_04885 [Bacteroidetes bacterium]|nr:hypothetical protein [Bacteroidota bacterium]